MDVHPDAIRPRALLDELETKARARPDVIRLDLSNIAELDAAAVATIRVATRRLARAGIGLDVHGASPKVAQILANTPIAEGVEATPAPGLLERFGLLCIAAWRGSVALADMTLETIRGALAAMIGRRSFSVRDTLDQVERMGADSVFIVTTLSFLLGLVLAFQTWVQLHAFGAEQLVLEFVGIGMSRGFAPFIVAIVVSGRTGSAIAAELSTMEMRQENDVLRVMGISPVRHLVVPRMIALTVIMPAVTLIATVAGIAGGMAVALTLSANWVGGLERMLRSVEFADLWLGAVKAVLFGWVIGLASSFTGLNSGYGAVSIGTAATRAVVWSIFYVMVVDAIVTTLWTAAQ